MDFEIPEVLTVLSVNVTAFWLVTPCSLISGTSVSNGSGASIFRVYKVLDHTGLSVSPGNEHGGLAVSSLDFQTTC